MCRKTKQQLQQTVPVVTMLCMKNRHQLHSFKSWSISVNHINDSVVSHAIVPPRYKWAKVPRCILICSFGLICTSVLLLLRFYHVLSSLWPIVPSVFYRPLLNCNAVRGQFFLHRLSFCFYYEMFSMQHQWWSTEAGRGSSYKSYAWKYQMFLTWLWGWNICMGWPGNSNGG